jgi:hypothetical protein
MIEISTGIAKQSTADEQMRAVNGNNQAASRRFFYSHAMGMAVHKAEKG